MECYLESYGPHMWKFWAKNFDLFELEQARKLRNYYSGLFLPSKIIDGYYFTMLGVIIDVDEMDLTIILSVSGRTYHHQFQTLTPVQDAIDFILAHFGLERDENFIMHMG